MLSSGQRQRHRRSNYLTSIGTNVLIAYGSYKIASWALKRWYNDSDEQEDEQQDFLPKSQQQKPIQSPSYTHHSSQPNHTSTKIQLRRCRDETWSIFASLLLPILRTKLEDGTKFSSLTKKLKRIRKRRRTLDENYDEAFPPPSTTKTAEDDSTSVRKRNDREEAETWRLIQIKTVTRMISTVYAHAFLILVLWVQVHVLGGRLHRQGLEARRSGEGEWGSEGEEEEGFDSHRDVLTRTFRAFFQDGIPKLIRTVEAIVVAELQDWNVIVEEEEHSDGHDEKGKATQNSTNNVTTTLGCVLADDFEDAIRQIRSSFETGVLVMGGNGIDGAVNDCEEEDDDSSSSFLISLFMPKAPTTTDASTAEDATTDDSTTVDHILNETWDLLESPIWEEVERDCLDASFDTLRYGGSDDGGGSTEGKGGWNELFAPEAHPNSSIRNSELGGDGTNNRDNDGRSGDLIEAVPLAYILTKLKKMTHNSFYTPVGVGLQQDVTKSCPNVYVQAIGKLLSLNELGDASFNSYY